MAGSVSRRHFTAAALALGTCTPRSQPVSLAADANVEYIVIGSGAGGGPLAANLARAGHKVMVMEAGGDDAGLTYSVPLFNGLATEDPRLRWDYFVHHYSDPAQRRRDSKYVAAQDGVLYPRAGTLGGCTAHNAMITIYPHAGDWDGIAALTGDASWRADAMRVYFERLEQCCYRLRPPTPALDFARHGFDGWLTTNEADPRLLARDAKLQRIVLSAAAEVGLGGVVQPFFGGKLDPNDWRLDQPGGFTGLSNIPLATRNGQRNGTRELLQDTAQALPDNLIIRTGVLVTRILFDGRRAIGVEYLESPSLYRADPRAAPGGPEPVARRHVLATREIVLCAGAFNSPQLLKLSGIGPRAELDRFAIPVVVDLPGVGENLQDRYEIGVVTRMRSDFALLEGCSFAPPVPGQPVDSCTREWQQGRGVYTTNGTIIGVSRRAAPERPDPDLFIFGLPGFFRGYYPGYSQALTKYKDHFTWAILKAHTRNTAGRVTLRSADPRDTPNIAFHYFEEGNDAAGEDLASVTAGIAFVRRMNAHLQGIAAEEVLPGAALADTAAVSGFVKDEAWGHHASCSNRMGPVSDRMAVVGSDFRVHGTTGLRVVDASVFPRIPGFFIVTPIYMISEKASDAILADAKIN